MDRNSNHTGATVALPVPVTAEGLFSHRATSDILSILVDTPHTAFGIRDLARATGYAHKSISDAVADLEAADLVETTQEGRKKLVQINRERVTKPDDPILQIPQSEFHEPVQALVDRLQDSLEGIRGIVLFGSVARGTADRRSDIDCFVLVDDEPATGQQRAHEITAALNETRFAGERYKFQVLVESVDSASQYGERLQEIVTEGLTLYETPALQELKAEVMTNGQ